MAKTRTKSPAETPAPARPGKAAAAPSAPAVVGFIDRMEDDVIEGWAVDPANAKTPATLRVMIDGHLVDTVVCDLLRQDVEARRLGVAKVGFFYRIPERFQDGMRHVLALSTLTGAPAALPSRAGTGLAEWHFCLRNPTRIEGVVDGLVEGLIRGWALRVNERDGSRHGGVPILVTCNGRPLTQLTADQFRPDVAETFGADPAAGFAFSPPPELRLGRPITLSFRALPDGVELLNSPMTVELPSSRGADRIQALTAQTDELFRIALKLRQELKSLVAPPTYELGDYPNWATRALAHARDRAIARYGADALADAPLVSIVCPVFRPRLADFLAAVDSVRAQTYANWELLLVDDASGDADLTAAITGLARADARIRPFVQRRNGGISRATNHALADARGDFVAFFDHDDLLEPAAIEILVRAARRTGAKLLYSDEDKIDAGGRFSEPHLKPDWNPRLLLSINYICHLVLAARDAVAAAGPLDPAMDGAQDHDFLLRLTERLEPTQIHHVPEVLYHWRKSANSTAVSRAAKPHAADAGERAIDAHLRRRALPARVESRFTEGVHTYRVLWRFGRAPRVAIIIPFKDHIDITRLCVERILAVTEGVEYEILLVDNWSESAEAQEFCATIANDPRMRVLRVEEPFNYSRLNNLAVAETAAPFLLFLNNDVIVSQPDWLRVLTDEARADARVGAVGAKLLYPNGSVQHAGVVLGVGGIADHIHRGLPGAAPGYVARAICAQELSAVTAACMLVRAEAFRAVGGFDAAELPVAFNDVDLCLKLRRAGWAVVWTPDVVAEHRESMSRGSDHQEANIARFLAEEYAMRARWDDVLPFDPFYNAQFSRESGIYRELAASYTEAPMAEMGFAPIVTTAVDLPEHAVPPTISKPHVPRTTKPASFRTDVPRAAALGDH